MKLDEPIDLRTLSTKQIEELLSISVDSAYATQPVDVETFITNDYYLGKTVGRIIFPYWVNVLKDLYPHPLRSPYQECVVQSAKGIGKSFVSATSILYDIYKLLCMKNPQAYYHLIPGSIINFIIFSVTKESVEQINLDILKSLVSESDFFKKKAKIKVSKTESIIHFGKGIQIAIGSMYQHAIGKTVFGGILDEGNFQREKSEQARTSYNSIIAGMQSRFMQEERRLPGLLWLLSSPNLGFSFVNERLEKASSVENSGIYAIKNLPIWKVRPELKAINNKTFKVFIGDDTKDPYIIKDSSSVRVSPSLVIDVPEQFKQDFELNIIDSIRDKAGIATATTANLIRSKDVLNNLMRIHPIFNKEELFLDMFDKSQRIERFLNSDYVYRPMRPEFHRFIHVDIGLTKDRLGMAAVYAEPQETKRSVPNKNDSEENSVIEIERVERFYFVDWVVAIKAIEGSEIPLYKMREFLLFLKNIGYPIKRVTFDSYNSRDSLQQLKLEGMNVDIVSVDKSRDPYLFLMDLIYREGILLPDHDLLRQELLSLQDNGKKIDHPPNMSKDCSDAVAGAVYSCLTSETVVRHPYLVGEEEKEDTSFIRAIFDDYQDKKINENIKRLFF